MLALFSQFSSLSPSFFPFSFSKLQKSLSPLFPGYYRASLYNSSFVCIWNKQLKSTLIFDVCSDAFNENFRSVYHNCNRYLCISLLRYFRAFKATARDALKTKDNKTTLKRGITEIRSVSISWQYHSFTLWYSLEAEKTPLLKSSRRALLEIYYCAEIKNYNIQMEYTLLFSRHPHTHTQSY